MVKPSIGGVFLSARVFVTTWALAAAAISASAIPASAQTTQAAPTTPPPAPTLLIGRNSNMLGGEQIIRLNPFEVRGDVLGRADNEPSCTISTRNPNHVLCGANTYRMVDVPGVSATSETRDAWQGVYQSKNGGDTWESTLHPGFFLDPRPHQFKLYDFRAAADPTLRSGPAGVSFYSGISFKKDKSVNSLFVSTFVDLNNRENDPMPFKFVRTIIIDLKATPKFIDKPWMYVEAAPPGQTCTMFVRTDEDATPLWVSTWWGKLVAGWLSTRWPGWTPKQFVMQQVPASIVHIAYSIFQDADDKTSDLMYTKSTNCGLTFSTPKKISSVTEPANGVAIAKPLVNGSQLIVAAWRRVKIAPFTRKDAILAVASTNDGSSFSAAKVVAEICPFDQGTTGNNFRTTGFPSMTMDASGRAYLAWTERERLTPGGACNPAGAARIMISTSTNGTMWSTPAQQAVPSSTGEHQILPSIAFTAGKLFLAWVDFTEDASGVFGKYVEEINLYNQPLADPPVPVIPPKARRHTSDVRAAMADPGAIPNFGANKAKVSQYLMGTASEFPGERLQLQWNAVNRRWARRGTVPFNGDYIDIATRPYLPPDLKATPPRPNWTPNNGLIPSPPTVLFTWTDNRDMRDPKKLNTDGSVPFAIPQYKAGVFELGPGQSLVDPSQMRQVCTIADVSKTGTTNQNVYSARGVVGFAASSPSGNKALGVVPRSFVVYVRNDSELTKTFRLQILLQPPGGTASFEQFFSRTVIEPVTITKHSSIARTVFVRKDATTTPLDPKATIRVDVIELGSATGAAEAIYLNGDRSAPDIDSPDIDSREVYTPDIDSPDIDSIAVNSPDIDSPDIDSPDIDSETLKSLGLGMPDIDSPDIDSPDIDSPDIDSPDIDSPETGSPDIDSAPIQDFKATMTNEGNTTAHYNAESFVKGATVGAFRYQLIVRRRYDVRAVGADCYPTTIPTTKVLVNLLDVDPKTPDIDSPDIDSSAPGTATFAVAPGDKVDIIVRARKINLSAPNLTLQNLAVATQQDAVNTDDAAAGITEAPIVTTFLSIGTNAVPPARVGTPYNYQLLASGGVPTYSWSVLEGGTGLPEGIALTVGGVLQGETNAAAGTYTFRVQAEDSSISHERTVRDLALTLIAAGSASLSFVTQPSDTQFGQIITPAVSVRLLDLTGAPVAGAAVTMSLVNARGAILSGLPSPSATTNIAGVAVFSNLRIDKAAQDYQLHAVSGTLQATSAPFNIIGTFVVSNISDSGPGSFRQAIIDANNHAAFKDTIVFAGPATITPFSPLPAIAEPIIISGFIGESSAPSVVLNGEHAGEGTNGLVITGGGSVIEGLVIQSFSGNGILIQGPGGNVVRSNYIGTNLDGTAAMPNGNGMQIIDSPNNVIGGTRPIDANLVSGNTGEGVRIDGSQATGNVIRGNVVGANVTQTGPLGNHASGVFIRRAPGNSVVGNRIDYNTGFAGVAICGNFVVEGFCGGNNFGTQTSNGNGNIVQGNFINNNAGRGLSLDGVANTLVGTADLNNISGNGINGVMIFGTGATGNRIVGNAINGNTGDGVQITGGGNTGNLLRDNSFINNTGLAIDLGGDGVTGNNSDDPLDADTGPNNLQNFPIINTASRIEVAGTFNSTANTMFTVQLYSSTACDSFQYGEGQNVLSTFSLATNPDGYASFAQDVELNTGDWVTATATDANNNTSEFSACALVSGSGGTDAVGDAGGAGEPDLRAIAAVVSGGNVTFSVRFAPGTFSPTTTLVDIAMDTDENTSTGHPGTDSSCSTDAAALGADYFVRMGGGSATVLHSTGCNTLLPQQPATIVNVTNGMNVTFPLSSIGGDNGSLRYKVITYRRITETSTTGIRDRLTDAGQPALLVQPDNFFF